MPVPSAITGISQTPGSNSPAGSESPALLDDYIRTVFAFIATLRDGQGLSNPVDLASAATTDIGAQTSPVVRITGTTTITSFGTNYAGPRFLVFGGALTLTHNATSLILPSGANITTAAGDTCIAVPNLSTPTGWRVLAFAKASGEALVIPSPINQFTNVTLTNQTAVDFTNIPSSAKQITLQIVSVSSNGTSPYLVQLGDSGGIESTGYTAKGVLFDNAGVSGTSYTQGFALGAAGAATVVQTGTLTLTKQGSSNTWVASGVFNRSDSSTAAATTSGFKTLSDVLTQVRLATSNGTDQFDAGVVGVSYS